MSNTSKREVNSNTPHPAASTEAKTGSKLPKTLPDFPGGSTDPGPSPTGTGK
jgi:hypothetical protein